jgi:hypothetical protein
MFAAGESGPKRAFLRLNHIDRHTPSQAPLQMIREYLQLSEGRHPGALKAQRLQPWCDLVLSWCHTQHLQMTVNGSAGVPMPFSTGIARSHDPVFSLPTSAHPATSPERFFPLALRRGRRVPPSDLATFRDPPVLLRDPPREGAVGISSDGASVLADSPLASTSSPPPNAF